MSAPLKQQTLGSTSEGSDSPSITSAFRRVVSVHDAHVGEIIDIANTAVGANTEFSVVHHLGFLPNQVEVLYREGQSDAYLQIKPSGTAWTKSLVYLKCATANAALRVRIS